MIPKNSIGFGIDNIGTDVRITAHHTTKMQWTLDKKAFEEAGGAPGYHVYCVRKVWGKIYDHIRSELIRVNSLLKISDVHNFEIDKSRNIVEDLLFELNYPDNKDIQGGETKAS